MQDLFICDCNTRKESLVKILIIWNKDFVIYKSNKIAWVTSEVILDLFKSHFAKEVWQHFTNMGSSEDCGILLLMDNFTVHPELNGIADNIITVFLPPSIISVIQPMDQGITHSEKKAPINQIF